VTYSGWDGRIKIGEKTRSHGIRDVCETGYSMHRKKIHYNGYCSIHCVKRREKTVFGVFFSERGEKTVFFLIVKIL
jgi:hypothetical protein